MEVRNVYMRFDDTGIMSQKFSIPVNQTETAIFELEVMDWDIETEIYSYSLDEAVKLRQFLKDVIRKYRDDNR